MLRYKGQFLSIYPNMGLSEILNEESSEVVYVYVCGKRDSSYLYLQWLKKALWRDKETFYYFFSCFNWKPRPPTNHLVGTRLQVFYFYFFEFLSARV